MERRFSEWCSLGEAGARFHPRGDSMAQRSVADKDLGRGTESAGEAFREEYVYFDGRVG